MFSFLKKKEKTVLEKQQDEIEAEFNPFDVSSVIAYLKKKKPDITDQEILDFFNELVKPAKDLDHLGEDGELPWGWITYRKDFIESVEKPFYKLMNDRAESQRQSPQEQIKALEALLQYINKTVAECKTKGECYEFYFQNYTLANGLQERFEKELEEIKANYDKLAADYNLKANFEKDVLPTLKKELLQIIKDNPDIMQKDLYKRFQKEAKPYISDILYHLDKDRIITREKSGNSYKLRMPM